ncbi:hypothetical protein [Sinorhizobium meliloti]|uniref:hypothetical protein n=1 Tax=Rhizobium meliloti TaxID=382 RepID=UPI003EBF0CA8
MASRQLNNLAIRQWRMRLINHYAEAVAAILDELYASDLKHLLYAIQRGVSQQFTSFQAAYRLRRNVCRDG